MGSVLVSLSEAARQRMRHLLETQGNGAEGIKLGVKPTGCSGYSYLMDFAREIGPADEVVESGGIKLVVDPMAVMYMFGTEMDYKVDKFSAQFVFNNPNQTSACGCGESVELKPIDQARMEDADA